ncbi:hypothetical protein PCE1_001441 [Barthelona sp. PCE]
MNVVDVSGRAITEICNEFAINYDYNLDFFEKNDLSFFQKLEQATEYLVLIQSTNSELNALEFSFQHSESKCFSLVSKMNNLKPKLQFFLNNRGHIENLLMRLEMELSKILSSSSSNATVMDAHSKALLDDFLHQLIWLTEQLSTLHTSVLHVTDQRLNLIAFSDMLGESSKDVATLLKQIDNLRNEMEIFAVAIQRLG